MDLLNDLYWRYACKWMNGRKIAKEDLDAILESIRLAPTSMGMQLFKVLVVEDREIIEKIYHEAAVRQKMLEGCSHLLVFAAYRDFRKENIEEYIDRLSEERNINGERLEEYRSKYVAYWDNMDKENITNWSIHQTYITMAYATVAAAKLKIDCTPVEGFDNKKLDQILDLEQQDLVSTLLLPLGYRDAEVDRSVGAAKVRKSSNELFTFL